jgi:hypothetical protein
MTSPTRLRLLNVRFRESNVVCGRLTFAFVDGIRNDNVISDFPRDTGIDIGLQRCQLDIAVPYIKNFSVHAENCPSSLKPVNILCCHLP